MPKRFVNPALSGLLCLVLLMLLIWQLSVRAHAEAQPQVRPLSSAKKILLLYTYGDGLPAYRKATAAFLSATTAGGVSTDDIFFEYLDLQRNKGAEYRQRLANLLRYKYAAHQVDLIVTVHNGALDFLLDEGKELFPDAPVLSYLIVRPELIEAKNTGRRILQRPQNLDMGGTLEIALKMFPATQNVIFVTGTAEGRLEYEAKRVFEPWRDKLKFQYTSDLSLEEILQLVASLPPRSIVIYCNVFSDKTGRTFTPLDVGKMVAKAANAPVFCLWDTLIGSGPIGGSLLSFEAEGAYAANVALDILNGKTLLIKPVTTLTTSKTLMFDWQQLKHWDLSEAALPKGSIVLNREFTLWNFKYYIIGTVAFCLLETAFILMMIVQRRRRKVAEESLRQKTKELDQFFNINMDLFCIANTSGYFEHLNPVWGKVLGYTEDELVAKRFLEFVHPDDLEHTEQALSALATQEHLPNFVNRYRCRDGTYRWLEWNSVAAGNLIYAAARDITERKQMQETIMKTAEEWQATFDSVQDLVMILDSEFKLVRVNAATLSFFNLPSERILGNYCYVLMHRRSEPVETCPLARMLKTKRHEETELYDEERDAWFQISVDPIVDDKAEIIRIIHTVKDVTERKRAEEALRESEERLRDITFSMADWVWEVDENGVYTSSSQKGFDLLGRCREDVIGKTPFDFMPPDEAKRVAAIFSEIAANKAPIKDLENWNIRKNGESICLLTNGVPILDQEGNLKGYRGVDKDITEHKRAEAEVARARGELLRVERLSRLGALTASLAHELNQPLGAILSSAQAALRFLQSATPDLTLFRTILQNIIQDDKRAAGVITSLRSMVKREEIEREPINISTVLNDVLDLFRSEAIVRNVTIERDFDGSLPLVLADKIQLQQVVLNLVMNAAEAMSESPREHEKRKIILRAQATDHGIQVAVRDFGPGVDPAKLNDIWQPFFTTKSTGMGMGLSVSRSIIQAHGGRLSAENHPGGGAIFTFEIPIYESGK